MQTTNVFRVLCGLIAASAILTACTTNKDEVPGNPHPKTTSSTDDESVLAIAACLRERGWAVEVKDGGVGPASPQSFPREQIAAYDADMKECMAVYDQANPPPSLGREDYAKLYRLELATRECLASLGYTSDVEPASEAAYVEALMIGGPPPWFAYQVLGELPRDEVARVQLRCPQPSL